MECVIIFSAPGSVGPCPLNQRQRADSRSQSALPVVAGIEVVIKAAHGAAKLFHQIGNATPPRPFSRKHLAAARTDAPISFYFSVF